MEYEYYLQLLADSTVFNETIVNAQQIEHFTDWMRDTPNLAYQYAHAFYAVLPSPRYETY